MLVSIWLYNKAYLRSWLIGAFLSWEITAVFSYFCLHNRVFFHFNHFYLLFDTNVKFFFKGKANEWMNEWIARWTDIMILLPILKFKKKVNKGYVGVHSFTSWHWYQLCLNSFGIQILPILPMLPIGIQWKRWLYW